MPWRYGYCLKRRHTYGKRRQNTDKKNKGDFWQKHIAVWNDGVESDVVLTQEMMMAAEYRSRDVWLQLAVSADEVRGSRRFWETARI